MRNAISDDPIKDANAVNLGAIATAFCCAIDDIVFVLYYIYIYWFYLRYLFVVDRGKDY